MSDENDEIIDLLVKQYGENRKQMTKQQRCCHLQKILLKSSTSTSRQKIYEQFSKIYSDFINDPIKGANNFSKEAMEMAGNTPNNSRSWKSNPLVKDKMKLVASQIICKRKPLVKKSASILAEPIKITKDIKEKPDQLRNMNRPAAAPPLRFEDTTTDDECDYSPVNFHGQLSVGQVASTLKPTSSSNSSNQSDLRNFFQPKQRNNSTEQATSSRNGSDLGVGTTPAPMVRSHSQVIAAARNASAAILSQRNTKVNNVDKLPHNKAFGSGPHLETNRNTTMQRSSAAAPITMHSHHAPQRSTTYENGRSHNAYSSNSKSDAAVAPVQDRCVPEGPGGFRTANQLLNANASKQQQPQQGRDNAIQYPQAKDCERASPLTTAGYGAVKKSLGARSVRAPFVPPLKTTTSNESAAKRPCLEEKRSKPTTSNQGSSHQADNSDEEDNSHLPDELKKFDRKIVEMITSEIMHNVTNVSWDEISGLSSVKKALSEIVIFPMLRPDLFKGLRGPPKGLLLFGPPGTGKTMIGKCIASQCKSTFFSISASSLTSKWVGEGEKMVRALFAVARLHQPAVIFLDEIDSLLSQRSDQEHESSRRIKTEFLVQLDGVGTAVAERLLVIGATNRPHEIDEAARRRFVKRLYVPLPNPKARRQIVENLLRQEQHSLTESDYTDVVNCTKGYSGADMFNLCKDAALGPLRTVNYEDMVHVVEADVRPITKEDFWDSLQQVKASVCRKDLTVYHDWNKLFGSYQLTEADLEEELS